MNTDNTRKQSCSSVFICVHLWFLFSFLVRKPLTLHTNVRAGDRGSPEIRHVKLIKVFTAEGHVGRTGKQNRVPIEREECLLARGRDLVNVIRSVARGVQIPRSV